MSIAHFVTRVIILAGAEEAGIDVDRLSFKVSFQISKTRLPECDAGSEASLTPWYRAVVWEISQERIPPRRNRINPRVTKRKNVTLEQVPPRTPKATTVDQSL